MASSQPSALRSSLLFLTGLIAAAAFAVAQDASWRLGTRGSVTVVRGAPQLVATPARRPLNAADRTAAEIAWAYFRQNTRSETGLVDSVAGYPSTTMWDIGSHLLALVSAHRLGLIQTAEFEARAARVIETLGTLPLVDGRLPNKAYDTRSLAMVDYDNTPVPEGIGWSAIDISRLLVSLRAIEAEAPGLRGSVRQVLKRWDLAALADAGEVRGAIVEGRDVRPLQEGRVGYEQYAARGLMLWGIEATSALSAARILDWTTVEGVDVAVDLRKHDAFGVNTPVTSEPYILLGLEHGLASEAALLADRIYRAQEARFAATGIPTMVSEDHLDRPPDFAYATVLGNGEAWAVLTEDGSNRTELRTLSTKAVFGWDALYGTKYTADLRAGLASDLARPGAGWLAGRYERDGTANAVLSLNTNAVVLEALHYLAFGPILSL
jgi:hypothetical protein